MLLVYLWSSEFLFWAIVVECIIWIELRLHDCLSKLSEWLVFNFRLNRRLNGAFANYTVPLKCFWWHGVAFNGLHYTKCIQIHCINCIALLFSSSGIFPSFNVLFWPIENRQSNRLNFMRTLFFKSLNESTSILSSYFWPISFTFISMAMTRMEMKKTKRKVNHSNKISSVNIYHRQVNLIKYIKVVH